MDQGLKALQERGFLQQCTDIDAVSELLTKEPTSFYVGFDPTGSSLHAGHMVPLYAMVHLARAGHKPIALIGGGTARIGDPSGKTEMRKMLTVEQIQANAASIRTQIESFLAGQGCEATVVDNADWLAGLNYIEFLRDIGRHFSVNRMLSFETYKMRLETGLSFIEFNYQLLQSYDYLVLNRDYNCRLQVGGDDQWGNIVAGVDLIRRVSRNESYGLTFPLVTRADGKKMGKTEQGAVFLDPEMFSVYDFYQYWRNVPDPDVRKFLYLYTFLPNEEIEELAAREGQELNAAKQRLAFELTRLVHGDEEATRAEQAATAAFGAGGSVGGGGRAGIPSTEIPLSELEAGISVLELFQRSGLCSSLSEARRLVEQGGARVNEQKIESLDELIGADRLEKESAADGSGEPELLLRAGKKRYHRIIPV